MEGDDARALREQALLDQIAALTVAQAGLTAAVAALTVSRAPAIPPTSSTTVAQLVTLYMATIEGEPWANVVRSVLRHGLYHFGARVADSILRAEWIHWRDNVRAKTPTIRRDPKTRAKTLPSVAFLNQEFKRWITVFRWGITEGVVTTNPLAGVPAKRGGKKHRHTRPTEDDVVRIIVASTPRGRAFVVVGARTGMRASELRTTPWKNVDLEAGSIKIEWHREKTKRGRWVPLTSDAVAALKAIRPDLPPRYVFESSRCPGHPVDAVTLWREYRGVVDGLGLEAAEGDGRVVYHDLRHVFAGWAVEHLPLPVVMAIGGWTDIRTLSRYVQVTDRQIVDAQAELERAIRKGPKAVRFTDTLSAEEHKPRARGPSDASR